MVSPNSRELPYIGDNPLNLPGIDGTNKSWICFFVGKTLALYRQRKTHILLKKLYDFLWSFLEYYLQLFKYDESYWEYFKDDRKKIDGVNSWDEEKKEKISSLPDALQEILKLLELIEKKWEEKGNTFFNFR